MNKMREVLNFPEKNIVEITGVMVRKSGCGWKLCYNYLADDGLLYDGELLINGNNELRDKISLVAQNRMRERDEGLNIDGDVDMVTFTCDNSKRAKKYKVNVAEAFGRSD